jgi:hypothetical protein
MHTESAHWWIGGYVKMMMMMMMVIGEKIRQEVQYINNEETEKIQRNKKKGKRKD